MTAAAVAHVTSLLGGGVNRHLRDIARSRSRAHLVWHVGERAEAMQADHVFRPLDPARVDGDTATLGEWLRSRGVGMIHVHSLEAAARKRARQAREVLGAGCVATLHDVLFLGPNAFDGADPAPDAAWLDANAQFLRGVDAVIAPSDYIAGLARRHIPGLEVAVVPNGSAPPETVEARVRPEFHEHHPRHVAIVLGAIGPHKGSEVLEELGSLLRDTGIAIVVIGYVERQVVPGWRHPGTLFIHGPWQDDELGSLVRGYGGELALFPNRVAESFSYALSDLWSCGLPVLAAPHGALRERVERHGGGWLLPRDFDAREVARRLVDLFSSEGAAEHARVKSQLTQADPGRIPSLEAMSRSLDALYDRFGIDVERPASASLERLLAANLDGTLFRAELARLADELAQALAANRELGAEIEKARRFEADSTAWIAKLEGDIGALKADLEREVAERRALGEEAQLLRDHREALERLPALVRRILLKKVRDARG